MNKQERVIIQMRQQARLGVYTGLVRTPADAVYMESTRYRHSDGTCIIFTRDSGHHSSGWWKNPDYEHCYHLSISFRDPHSGEPIPFDYRKAKKWARLFFGDNTKWLWVEPAYTAEGKELQVFHYRLFCDPNWQPIKPRGEVYTTTHTPAGWKSFSEIHGAAADNFEPPMGHTA